MDAKKDFFISYTKADEGWAEWIAWQLEEAGYTTVLQAWDFRPGSNFVLEMQQATLTLNTERTIAVLSPDYLTAKFTQPEWAAAFRQDPKGEKGLLLPVLVRECKPEGLLGQIVYINLVGLDEAAARDALLKGVIRGRIKPDEPPCFPGDKATPGRRVHTVRKPEKYPGEKTGPLICTVPTRAMPGASRISSGDKTGPLICNVPPPNSFFTGREEILERLCISLRAGGRAALTQPQAICGLGGIGKTQTAIEYAHRHRDDYKALLWAKAGSREAIVTDFAALASLLDLPEKEAKDQSLAVNAVKLWLEERTDWFYPR